MFVTHHLAELDESELMGPEILSTQHMQMLGGGQVSSELGDIYPTLQCQGCEACWEWQRDSRQEALQIQVILKDSL